MKIISKDRLSAFPTFVLLLIILIFCFHKLHMSDMAYMCIGVLLFRCGQFAQIK